MPFVIAPADRCRITGGKLDPSRCHGALICFSFSCKIAFSKFDSCVTGPLSVERSVAAASAFLCPGERVVVAVKGRHGSKLRLRGFFKG